MARGCACSTTLAPGLVNRVAHNRGAKTCLDCCSGRRTSKPLCAPGASLKWMVAERQLPPVSVAHGLLDAQLRLPAEDGLGLLHPGVRLDDVADAARPDFVVELGPRRLFERSDRLEDGRAASCPDVEH